MLRRFSSLLIASALIATPAMAAQRAKPAEAPPPPPFHVDVATKPMAFARLAITVPTRTVIGQFDIGFLCLGPRNDIFSEDAFNGHTTADYTAAFTEEASGAGYRLASSQTSLFDTKEVGAEILVGAAITNVTENGCLGVKRQLDATVTVEWQVFDPLNKKIIFRANTTGKGKAPAEYGQRVYGLTAPREAFKDAAKALLSNPEFIEAVKDPRGGAPAPSNGDLFPEAKTPADPASVPAPTAEPAALPPVFRVPALPLSTTPFPDQVEALRGQVVTVLNAGGSGSGFYISDTLLLTNNHVVTGYSTQKIRFLNGREIEGRVLATNARRDIAVIKTEPAGVSGLPLQFQNPKLTSQVFVIGSPLGQDQEGSITSGIVSAFRTEKEGPFIQSDVGVTHGNSGGPMFDEKGNVIGVVDIGKHDQYGLPTAVNLFIPIADALKNLGIGMDPASAATAAK